RSDKCCKCKWFESWSKIRFIYPGCVEDLLQEVASLHQMASAPSPPPSLILVDGLEWYLQGREEESAAARLAALLCDTAAFLTRDLDRRGEGRGPCRLIVSFHPDRDGRGPGEAVLSVLDRYFQVKCGLDEAGAEGSRREWHVCMSGPSSSESDVGKRWHLVVEDNGAMEFREIANRATESCEKYDKS
uniref:Uncharacterized protein n=1 Tax=Denticeps clupeoides TaxID=299321 RepID=A0AAY4C7S5_9TELE